MSEFKYLSEKILDASFIEDPCQHIEIKNFFKKEHIDKILSDKQIHFEKTNNTRELIDKLIEKKYKIQSFPGCCSNAEEYITRLESDMWPTENKSNPVSSYGITFRVEKYQSQFMCDLIQYLNGDEFHSCLKKKFSINESSTIITAVQKNLSKYEISPHPDVRKKCMTYLLNINKDDTVENYDVHTHLLKFKKEYEYIYDIWENETNRDRSWVPWDWCETVKTIKTNNTIVVFPPTHKTLHAVKLDYPHNDFQRTQIYGNLMYTSRPKLKKENYRDLIK